MDPAALPPPIAAAPPVPPPLMPAVSPVRSLGVSSPQPSPEQIQTAIASAHRAFMLNLPNVRKVRFVADRGAIVLVSLT
jgi:hypothetical protein